MVKKILIFRTDRIGDLIVTCPAIISIKKSIPDSHVTLIASSRNYDYAKSLNFFDSLYGFPKKNILKKIFFIHKLRKKFYDYIFVFDGKERSVLTAALSNSRYKVALISNFRFYYNFFNLNFFRDAGKSDLISVFQKMITHAKLNTEIANYDFLKNKIDNNFSVKIPIKDYIHIHFDEKWFSELYINTYTNINPGYDDFEDLLNSISEKFDLLITTGLEDTDLINKLKVKYFQKISDKIFLKKNSNKFVYLIFKPSFNDIESLLRKTKVLISCHGSILHASNSFDIKKIDIIEKEKKNFYRKFTVYLSEYTYLHRQDFKELKNKILEKLRNF